MHFNPQDGSSTVLQNISIQPPHYMVQQPQKLQTVFILVILAVLWCYPHASLFINYRNTNDYSVYCSSPWGP